MELPQGRRNSECGSESPGVAMAQQHSFYTRLPGTVSYSSPEMVSGEAYDQRTDIFSLGCLLYELVTLDKAYEGDGNTIKLRLQRREEPVRLNPEATGCDPRFAYL